MDGLECESCGHADITMVYVTPPDPEDDHDILVCSYECAEEVMTRRLARYFLEGVATWTQGDYEDAPL